jgi:hypothetical protein
MSNNFKVHKLKQEESKDFQSVTSLQIQGYSRPSIFVFKFKDFQVLYTNPVIPIQLHGIHIILCL